MTIFISDFRKYYSLLLLLLFGQSYTKLLNITRALSEDRALHGRIRTLTLE